MLRIVLDTDVVVAAFDSRTGASRQLLLDLADGKAQMVVSTVLMLEYEAVLTRPAMLARTRLTVDDIGGALDEIAAFSAPAGLYYRWRPATRDKGDDMVLETAINGMAHAIATFNVRDMAEAAASFGIVVERPAQVLRRIRS
jgi:putative PIN family toxin of toxin-antitoxin system